MRKSVTLITALIYLFSVTGVNVYQHYCSNNIAGWGIFHSTTCSVCGMQQDKKANGCCKDESTFFKNNPDQQNTETGLSFAKTPVTFLPDLLTNSFTRTKAAVNKIFRLITSVHDPSHPLYIRYSVFLI